MPTYKLMYFDTKGRAETIRLILATSGTKFEDVRITSDQWPTLKPKTPFGVLPVLEINGKKLGGSGSICRFLAKENGLSGKNSWQQGQVDAIADVIVDIMEKAIPAVLEKDETKQAAMLKEYGEKTLPAILDNVEKFLIENGGGDGWLVGKNMTWADLQLYSCIENVQEKMGDIMKGHPKITALVDRVAKHPKVAEYLKKRPDS